MCLREERSESIKSGTTITDPLLETSFMGFLRAAKFTNISSITVFFPASQGADETCIYYLGFLGQWSEVSESVIEIGYGW